MTVLSLVKNSWQNTKAMPVLLRMFSQGAMVASPILLIFLVLPLTDWNVDGKSMSYAELWKSGAGVVAVMPLLLAALGGWGIAAKVKAARWSWVAMPLLPALLLPFFPALSASSSSRLADIGSGVVTALIIYGALFHISAVQKYFGGAVGRAGA